MDSTVLLWIFYSLVLVFFKEYDKRRLWPRESLVAISLSWRECSSLISKRFYVVKGICFFGVCGGRARLWAGGRVRAVGGGRWTATGCIV